MPPHPLTNFEMQSYFQNEPLFNSTYSKNNLPNIKNGVWEINIDDFKSLGTPWIAFYANIDDTTSFDSFWVEFISKEIKKKVTKI